MLLEPVSRRRCLRATERAKPGSPVLLPHVVNPIIAVRVLLLWRSAHANKTDIRLQILEDMASVRRKISVLARAPQPWGIQTYPQSSPVPTEIVMWQKGHSKGPSTCSFGIGGTHNCVEAGVVGAFGLSETSVSFSSFKPHNSANWSSDWLTIEAATIADVLGVLA